MLIRHCLWVVTLSIIFLLITNSHNYGQTSVGQKRINPQLTQRMLQPDLMISSIDVNTANHQPLHFSFNVYVSNAGKVKSGQYELLLSIMDINRGSTYPEGTFLRSGLNPGENVCAYSRQNRMVNDPGNYQIIAEIRPFGSANVIDGNPNNNRAIKSFIVH
jgi:CARDB